jgi:hypothetical protein
MHQYYYSYSFIARQKKDTIDGVITKDNKKKKRTQTHIDNSNT